MDLSTQWSTVQGPDGAFDAFLALPRSGHGPTLLLLQEIFGVNAHIRAVAEQYAADGYVVLAPDLFWRQGKRLEFGYDEADWGRAAQCMQRAEVAQAQADIGAAAAALRAMPGAEGRLAALGYCWGGRMAYLALANGHAEHAVAYYGGGIQDCLARADDIRAPLLLHFGGATPTSRARRCARLPNVSAHTNRSTSTCIRRPNTASTATTAAATTSAARPRRTATPCCS